MALKLKKHNPGCDCCGLDCPYCSGTPPATITVTMSGWGGGTRCSNCSPMNATFVLAYLPVAGTCRYEYHGTFDCAGKTVNVDIVADAYPFPWPTNIWGWNVKITLTYPSPATIAWVTYQWYSGGYVAFDCAATRTANVGPQVGYGWICTWPSTIQIN